MKLLRFSPKPALFCACLGAVATVITGCGSLDQAGNDPVNPRQPYAFPGQPGQPTPTGQVAQTEPGAPPRVDPREPVGRQPTPPAPGAMPFGASALRVGDIVTVSFSDSPQPIPFLKAQLAEDGMLTLPLNVRVQATGKTPRALEQEIRGEYVPKYYRFLTVTVQTEQRAYYVGGEVKIPNRQPYVGEMTVLRAIQTAGDFTDYANKKNIELIRENGERHTINWHKALKDPKLDLPVYPNDRIHVHTRRW
jgi:protein involved in polysaccharide export with SLBB domain